MFEELLERLGMGVALVAEGQAIVDEVVGNIEQARALLTIDEIGRLAAMLATATAKSEQLSARIQGA